MTQLDLQRRARACGIRTSYINAAGKRVSVTSDVLSAILEAFDAEPSKFDPVIVAWDGKLKLPGRAPAQLRLESGETISIKAGVMPKCPYGYHTLRAKDSEVFIISAPSRSYSNPEMKRAWGVFAPMYALRGQGGFAEWWEMVDWLHPLGATVVATLPLLASFLGSPTCEPSPYSPASRLFWNELYLNVEHQPAPPAKLLDYPAFAKAKREALERLVDTNSKRFKAFRTRHPRLEDYAAFRAAGEKLGCSWHTWPERMRNGTLLPGDYDERSKNYHSYAQWLAQEQMDQLLRHCEAKGMKFYLDLPLGVHPNGYDVWRQRDSFASGASVGAPPDLFFTKGQDWGFPPLHPQRIRQNHYRYVIEYLRFQMRHTGLLRIDHVMGLHRLYWIPKGHAASQGAYVQYPAEELYAILCLESHRHRTVLVGENLGTVPPEVNKSMERHDLRQTYVLQYELQPKSLRPPPRKSVAGLNTHDMPTFEAFLRGLDIDDRHDLGLVANPARERRHRKKLIAALQKFLGKKSDLLEGALRWLGQSDAELVLVNLEDLWRETLPQNVPGTSCERPNWRRKLRYTLQELRRDGRIQKLLRVVNTVRMGNKSTPGARGRWRTIGSRGPTPRTRANVLAPRGRVRLSPKKLRD